MRPSKSLKSMSKGFSAMQNFSDGERILLRLLLAGALFSLMVACTKCNEELGLEQDWIGEELAEGIIKNQTGIDIDLTPESPE